MSNATVNSCKAESAQTASAHAAAKPQVAEQPALCIVGDGDAVLFGLTTAERLERQFRKAGVTDLVSQDDAATHNGRIILARGDAVIDQPLIPVLATRPGLVLLSDCDDRPVPLVIATQSANADDAISLLQGAGPSPESLDLQAETPEGLGVAFWKGLRKRETPYATVVAKDTRPSLEWRMFMGTYKGATDFVTKHVWPRPAFHVTRWLAGTFVTPNMVTTVGAILTVLAFWLFIYGYFLTGLVAAWAMTFLDTVDGKLARTTLTSSKWGDIFDHGIDLIHPPFWYAAWGYGVLLGAAVWSDQMLWTVLGAIFAGYILQRLMEGIAIKWLGLEIHIWRPIDTVFRQITARRNPNLALLTFFAILTRPDLGLLAVAWWTGICLVLHGIQMVQAFSAKRADGPLQSWMSAPTAPK